MAAQTIEVDNIHNLNPNDLHDYLITNGCPPINVRHNAFYREGVKIQEATKIEIDTSEDMLYETIGWVQQFTSINTPKPQSAADVMG
jgi:hypothetical protein